MIREELRDRVTWLTFDRPERLNAFTADDYVSLRERVERIAGDDGVRAVVLTGHGRAFSAGADRSLVDGTASERERELAAIEFPALLGALEACSKPILAAVNGLAVGFGATVLLYCDLVLMAESARLRLPFTSLGIVPEAGSSALLPARARGSDAVWAMLSSEWIDAPGALAMGFAWRVVPDDDLGDATQQAAAAIAAHDPAAVAATKRLLTAGRAEIARAAIEREYAAMQALTGKLSPPA
ncbi:MAG TPA: enoyl-CoA hydratase/isomerase family protein [Acidimicrobiia bacterium]|nr:enoyl-CoA hydratase/isomerase family protein [Acidimicrobiia bacterium]